MIIIILLFVKVQPMINNDSKKRKKSYRQTRKNKNMAFFYHSLDVFEFSVHVYVSHEGKIHSKVKA